MGDSYQVLFSNYIKKDISAFPRNIRNSIIRTINDKLSIYPQIYGERLKHDLKGYWKLKISKYRIVYEIKGKAVKVWGIYLRKDDYESVKKRIGL